jgi:hypothetical protein
MTGEKKNTSGSSSAFASARQELGQTSSAANQKGSLPHMFGPVHDVQTQARKYIQE